MPITTTTPQAAPIKNDPEVTASPHTAAAAPDSVEIISSLCFAGAGAT